MTNQSSDSQIAATNIPKQKSEYQLEKTPCCYYLREGDTQNRIKLNQSSALIWQVSTGEWTVTDIVDVLKENYPESEAAIKNDVYRTLKQLVDENAIELLDSKT